MSAARCFLDTNIFHYSVDRSDARKQAIADRLIEDALYQANGVISHQVVQEFVNVSLKKFPAIMSEEESSNYLRKLFQTMVLVESSMKLFDVALAIY